MRIGRRGALPLAIAALALVPTGASAAVSGQIAYTAIPKAGHPWRLALLDLRTKQKSYLTPSGEYAEMPSWSPDGKQIAFARSTAGGAQELVVLNVATGKQRLIAAGPYLNEWPAWSPDGARIAFVRSPVAGGGQQIWSIRPNGEGLRQLTHAAGLGRPAWSPNGKKIIYGRLRNAEHDAWDLWLMHRDGSDEHRLARNGTAPAWEPNGKQIAFGVPRRGPRGCCLRDLFLMQRDGNGRRLLAKKGGVPSWSPNGKTIVFQHFQSGRGWNIWTVAPDGSGANQLTSAAGDETTPAWRPEQGPRR
jgi:Tol biopolymer transport system component